MNRSDIERFSQRIASYVGISIFIFALDGAGLLIPIKAPSESLINYFAKLRQPVVSLAYAPYKMAQYYRTGIPRIIDLENRLAEASVGRAQLAQLEVENRDLRALLDAPVPKEWQYVVAPVLGYRKDELLLGVGSLDGVEVGASVIYQDSFIGVVAKVSIRQSRVTPVTSRNSKVAVTISGTRIDGLVSGGQEGLVLTQILQNANIQPAQVVVTSGIDEIAPRLVVGSIESIKTNDNGLFQEAEVAQAIDVSRLTNVFILRK